MFQAVFVMHGGLVRASFCWQRTKQSTEKRSFWRLTPSTSPPRLPVALSCTAIFSNLSRPVMKLRWGRLYRQHEPVGRHVKDTPEARGS